MVVGTSGHAASSSSTGAKERRVECYSMVLMKIVRICRDNYPTPVNGQLLGMDMSRTSRGALEVTDCFQLPNKKFEMSRTAAEGKDVEDRLNAEMNRYGSLMVELLKSVKADCLDIGWFQTMSFDTFKDVDIIDSLCEYQDQVDQAIVLGFDPMLGALGLGAFRAYRVSSEFLALHRTARTSGASVYKQLNSSCDILEELSIRVRDPLLVEAFLLEWTTVGDPMMTVKAHKHEDLDDGDREHIAKKELAFISSCLEELNMEQEKLMKYQRDSLRQQMTQKQFVERRRQENDQRKLKGEDELPMSGLEGFHFRRIEQPSQLATLLMSTRVGIVNEDVKRFASSNLAKISMLDQMESRPQTPLC